MFCFLIKGIPPPPQFRWTWGSNGCKVQQLLALKFLYIFEKIYSQIRVLKEKIRQQILNFVLRLIIDLRSALNFLRFTICKFFLQTKNLMKKSLYIFFPFCLHIEYIGIKQKKKCRHLDSRTWSTISFVFLRWQPEYLMARGLDDF